MKKTLLLITEDIKSATSHYRGYGELSKISKQYDFNIKIATGLDWHDLLGSDAVFMERPYSPPYRDFMLYAQKEGVPVWIDYDDYLLGVPGWNPTAKLYSKKENRKSLSEILHASDVSSFSTKHLMELMSPRREDKDFVIQNGIAKSPEWKKRNEEISVMKNNNSVLWRGSETHQKDLLSFAAQIVEAANGYPEWKFDFMGYNPWFISDYIPYTQFIGAYTLRSYWDKVANCGASIIIVPLFDDDFNRAKSNIAALEASWLIEANVICPDWDEWQVDGWSRYKSTEEFKELLMKHMHDGYNRTMAEAALKDIHFKYIGSDLFLSPQNHQRIEILKKINII